MYPNGGNWNTNWPSVFSHLFNCAVTDLTKFLYVDITNRSSSNLKGIKLVIIRSSKRWHRAVNLSDEFPFSHDRL